jgi:hypothetical protein
MIKYFKGKSLAVAKLQYKLYVTTDLKRIWKNNQIYIIIAALAGKIFSTFFEIC